MASVVIMPRQGQSVESCIITEWCKNAGDKVEVGEVLFTCETDKASFDVEAEFSGTVLALLAEEGDDVPCLDNVCVIGEEGEDISEFMTGSKDDSKEEAAEEDEQKVVVEAVITSPEKNETGDIKISPRAKNLAKKQNADLSKAEASGPYGRIIERDVKKLSASSIKVTGAASALYQGGADGSGLAGAVTTKDINKRPVQSADIAPVESEYTDEKISNVRKVIGKSMHASLSEMAQLTLNASFDATELLAFRKTVKQKGETIGLGNITLNDMILFTVSKILLSHRDCNAHYLGDKMRYFRDLNMGIAVDTERGLLVPTVFGANNMTLNELSSAAKAIIEQAKSGSISPDLLSGGTFTVTNLGVQGIESFTPVINPPQTCILGVCTITDKVAVVDGELKTYKNMGLSLTFDHRALDGAPAAKFLKDLCTALENFNLLLSK